MSLKGSSADLRQSSSSKKEVKSERKEVLRISTSDYDVISDELKVDAALCASTTSLVGSSFVRSFGVPLTAKTAEVKRGVRGGKAVKLKGNKGPSFSSSLPPVLNVTPKFTHTYRYITNATLNVSISISEMLGSIGGICTVANSALTCWTSSFRIHKVTVYPPVSTTTTYQNYLDWATEPSGYYPDSSKSYVAPSGVTIPKPMVFKPPKNSLASYWLNSTGAVATSKNLFAMVLQAGAIVDLTVEQTLPVVFSADTQLVQLSITTGTLKTVYYTPLDGTNNKCVVADGRPTTV